MLARTSKEECRPFSVDLINTLLLKRKQFLDFPLVGTVYSEAQGEAPGWALASRGKDVREMTLKSSSQMEWVMCLGCQSRAVRNVVLESVLLGRVIQLHSLTLGKSPTLSKLQFPPVENRKNIYQSIDQDCFGDEKVMHVRCLSLCLARSEGSQVYLFLLAPIHIYPISPPFSLKNEIHQYIYHSAEEQKKGKKRVRKEYEKRYKRD